MARSTLPSGCVGTVTFVESDLTTCSTLLDGGLSISEVEVSLVLLRDCSIESDVMSFAGYVLLLLSVVCMRIILCVSVFCCVMKTENVSMARNSANSLDALCTFCSRLLFCGAFVHRKGHNILLVWAYLLVVYTGRYRLMSRVRHVIRWRKPFGRILERVIIYFAWSYFLIKCLPLKFADFCQLNMPNPSHPIIRAELRLLSISEFHFGTSIIYIGSFQMTCQSRIDNDT